MFNKPVRALQVYQFGDSTYFELTTLKDHQEITDFLKSHDIKQRRPIRYHHNIVLYDRFETKDSEELTTSVLTDYVLDIPFVTGNLIFIAQDEDTEEVYTDLTDHQINAILNAFSHHSLPDIKEATIKSLIKYIKPFTKEPQTLNDGYIVIKDTESIQDYVELAYDLDVMRYISGYHTQYIDYCGGLESFILDNQLFRHEKDVFR